MFGFGKASVPRHRINTAVAQPKREAPSRLRWKPRAARKAAWAECFITFPPDRRLKGILLDVSETGVRIRFRSRQVVPSRVMIDCAALRLSRPAYAVRTDHFDIAFRFVDDLRR